MLNEDLHIWDMLSCAMQHEVVVAARFLSVKVEKDLTLAGASFMGYFSPATQWPIEVFFDKQEM